MSLLLQAIKKLPIWTSIDKDGSMLGKMPTDGWTVEGATNGADTDTDILNAQRMAFTLLYGAYWKL